jgi:hypothetical protein
MEEPRELEVRRHATIKRKNYGRRRKGNVQRRQTKEKVARIVGELMASSTSISGFG